MRTLLRHPVSAVGVWATAVGLFIAMLVAVLTVAVAPAHSATTNGCSGVMWQKGIIAKGDTKLGELRYHVAKSGKTCVVVKKTARTDVASPVRLTYSIHDDCEYTDTKKKTLTQKVRVFSSAVKAGDPHCKDFAKTGAKIKYKGTWYGIVKFTSPHANAL